MFVSNMKKNDCNNTDKPHLTKEEALTLEKALADKEFRKLLAEYVEEISDPKHRDEQEKYISQLESKHEIPKGKQIVKPEPLGFVLKFKYSKKIKPEGTVKEYNDRHKLFVNIVSSTLIDKPRTEDKKNLKEKDVKCGSQWFVPYSFGPLRMEKDKNKSLVPTFDCCFHPESLTNADRINGFKDILAQTARDGVIHSFKTSDIHGEEVELEKAYHILRGVKYKNGSPPVMMIDVSSQKPLVTRDVLGNHHNPVTKITTSSLQTASEIDNKKEVKDQIRGDKQKNTGSIRSQLKKGFFLSSNNKDASSKHPNIKSKSLLGGGLTYEGKEIPKYDVSERIIFDLADNTHQESLLPSPNRKPKSIIYRIYLPKISRASEVDLDVGEDKLLLQSTSIVKSDYLLDVKLPYKIKSNEGEAKWDLERKVLTLTLYTQLQNNNIQQ